MTQINIDRDWKQNQKIDQAQFADGKVSYVASYTERVNIYVSNNTLADKPLVLDYYINGDMTAGNNIAKIIVGENAHLQFGQMTDFNGPTGMPPVNFKLEANSILEFDNNYFSSKFSSGSVTIDMGWNSSAKLVFNNEIYPENGPIILTPTIRNLSYGDQISVTGATQATYKAGLLQFQNDNGDLMGEFHAEGLVDDYLEFKGGSVTYYSCFLRGTHISVPEGEVKVEDLQPGDLIVTAQGHKAEIKWIGKRKLVKADLPAQDYIRACPIVIKKNALAENVPHRDLTLSPGHHFHLDGALVPAIALINGCTIIQQFDMPEFEYFHIELERFEILLAENAPAESLVPTSSRSMFDNGDTDDKNISQNEMHVRPPLVDMIQAQEGPVVEAIREKLFKRVEQITNSARTNDASLYLEVNGRRIEASPRPVDGGVGTYRFKLPPKIGDIYIRSRSSVARDMVIDARRDTRRIGVGIASIAIVDAQGRTEIDLLDGEIRGLHKPQQHRGNPMRWTNGTAVIPPWLCKTQGNAVLELSVVHTYTYWHDV